MMLQQKKQNRYRWWFMMLGSVIVGVWAWVIVNQRPELSNIKVFTFQPDGRFAVAVSEHEVRRYSWPELHVLAATPSNDNRNLWSTAVSANQRWVALAHRESVDIWDTETLTMTTTIPLTLVHAMQFDPTGMVLLLVGRKDLDSPNNEVWKYTLDQGRVIKQELDPSQSGFITMSIDGKMSAYRTISNDGTSYVEVRRTKDNVVIQKFEVSKNLINVEIGVFSANNQYFAGEVYLDGSHIIVWDLVTGQKVNTMGTVRDQINTMVFSPDGKMIAVGGGHGEPIARIDTSVYVWKVTDASLQYHFYLNLENRFFNANPVNQLTFSLDGKTLAGCFWDGTVTFWSIK